MLCSSYIVLWCVVCVRLGSDVPSPSCSCSYMWRAVSYVPYVCFVYFVDVSVVSCFIMCPVIIIVLHQLSYVVSSYVSSYYVLRCVLYVLLL